MLHESSDNRTHTSRTHPSARLPRRLHIVSIKLHLCTFTGLAARGHSATSSEPRTEPANAISTKPRIHCARPNKIKSITMSLTRAHLLVCLCVALFCSSAAAQIIRSDNSPVCNTYLPQCEAKCKRGEAYIFVCSAGNGPQGGPYIICRCAAPFTPVGPPQQSKRQNRMWHAPLQRWKVGHSHL